MVLNIPYKENMFIKEGKINLVNISLLLYIFSIVVFQEGSSVIKITRVIFVAIVLINMITHKKAKLDVYSIWMLVFWTFCTISLTWTIGINNTKNMIMTLLYNLVCNFLIINLLYEDQNRIQIIFKTIIFSSIILFINVAAKYGMFFYANGARGGREGIESANLIGMIAAISAVLSIYFFKEKGTRYKIIYVITTILNCGILILSASRKAILFLLIPLMIYYIMNSKNVLKMLKNIVIALVIFVIAYLLIMNTPVLYNIIGNRIEGMINGFIDSDEADASTGLRLKMIEWGLEWFEDKPWFGHGLDTYRNLLGRKGTTFGAEGVYAHNNYIELLVDVGIVGTAIYYLIYIVILKKSIKTIKERNTLGMFMIGILIAFLINDYGMVSYYSKIHQTVLPVIYIIICYRQNNQNNIKLGLGEENENNRKNIFETC